VVEWSPTHVSWVGLHHELVTVGSLQEAASQLPGRDLVVAVSRRSAFVRALRVPNAGRPEVRRILEMQVGQMFPIPSSELAFDFHLSHDITAEGRFALIAAMRASDLTSMHQQAKSAGLKISQVTLASLGSPLVAHSLGFDNAAVVHRTAEGLAVDLVAGGELRYSRIAPMPATSIGIDAEVSRTYAAAVMSCAPTVAAGGLMVAEAEASTSTWALESLAGSHVDINIETVEQTALRLKRSESSRMRSSLVVLTAGLLLAGWQYMRWNTAQTAYDQVASQWKRQETGQKTRLDADNSQLSSLTNVKKALDLAFHPAQTFSDMVATASNDITPGIWLTGFSLERGKPLTIRGTAMGGQPVSDYQNALDAEKRFRNVTLLFATNTLIQNTPVVQFSISAFPVGNLPLAQPTKKKAGAGQ